MSYATPTQMLQFVDARLVGDLCGDQGFRISSTALLTDTNVIVALSSASGLLNTSVLVGNRYTVAQIEALTGDDITVVQSLTSWIAFGMLAARRGRDPKEYPQYVQALELLDRIEAGDKMFNVGTQAQVASENFMTAGQYAQLGLIRDRCPKYFPVRRCQIVQGG